MSVPFWKSQNCSFLDNFCGKGVTGLELLLPGALEIPENTSPERIKRPRLTD
jgi:hypothetical protein